MNNPLSKKIPCGFCTTEQEPGKLFCSYCGRDHFFGVKKWEYLLGGLFLMMVIPASIAGVNKTVNIIKPLFASPTPGIVQAIPSATLPPSPQSFENLPATPSPQPTKATISTSIPVPTACSEISITMTDTPKGDILHIERCSDGWKYDSPPVAKGAYGLAPNDKFLIYCTNVGDVYAVKIGDSNFRFVKNIRKEMPIFHRNDDVALIITFVLGENQYWAKITDRISGQNVDVKIPLKISQ